MFWCRSFFGVVVLVALFVSQSASAAYFQGLGDLPGGIVSSTAYGISADGSVVVGESRSASGIEAFRWTAGGGMTGLGDLPGGSFWSSARGVSADGSVIVGSSATVFGAASATQAFKWTASTGMVGLGSLTAGCPRSYAYGVSGDGAVVVGAACRLQYYEMGFPYYANYAEIWGWPSGGPYAIGTVEAVTADGSVAVGEWLGAAFRWTQGGSDFLSLGYAQGVSDDGSVVVGSNGGGQAFRWTSSGGVVGLGDLAGGSVWSSAADVSADGSVVVGSSNAASGKEAFLWTEALGMVSLRDYLIDLGLDLTGWTLSDATAISADGYTIVGTGTNPSGQTEAWIANVPEPSAALLVGVGLIGLALQRRRKNA